MNEETGDRNARPQAEAIINERQDEEAAEDIPSMNIEVNHVAVEQDYEKDVRATPASAHIFDSTTLDENYDADTTLGLDDLDADLTQTKFNVPVGSQESRENGSTNMNPVSEDSISPIIFFGLGCLVMLAIGSIIFCVYFRRMNKAKTNNLSSSTKDLSYQDLVNLASGKKEQSTMILDESHDSSLVTDFRPVVHSSSLNGSIPRRNENYSQDRLLSRITGTFGASDNYESTVDLNLSRSNILSRNNLVSRQDHNSLYGMINE